MSTADNLVTIAAIEQALIKRWPENKIEPTLDRIAALTDLLGSPNSLTQQFILPEQMARPLSLA